MCDGADNDCDGNIDEDFQLQTNVNRCGACNHPCIASNATSKCMNGTCQIASCDPDYHDDAAKAGPDCDLGPCTIAGAEICNGVDDDCNGLIDDHLTPPGQFCNTNGACANAVPQCQGVNKWQCSILPSASELCNGIDDNCNRQVDEGFPIGQSCAASGVGACATKGTLACSPDHMATVCVDAQGMPVTTGTGTQEVCNGLDDDCDGNVDEPCGGMDANCVSDDWVSLGNGTEIYQYEASRPDATGATTGSLTTRACSAPNRLPWTNLT
jgi:Notch-like protein